MPLSLSLFPSQTTDQHCDHLQQKPHSHSWNLLSSQYKILLLLFHVSSTPNIINFHHCHSKTHIPFSVHYHYHSVMAASRSNPRPFKVTIAVIFIFSLAFLPPKSVLSSELTGDSENLDGEGKKMVLGSRPPGCENKCLSCSPCMAALVVPVHRKGLRTSSFREEDDGYYLLSWKCRCGNRIYQP